MPCTHSTVSGIISEQLDEQTGGDVNQPFLYLRPAVATGNTQHRSPYTLDIFDLCEEAVQKKATRQPEVLCEG